MNHLPTFRITTNDPPPVDEWCIGVWLGVYSGDVQGVQDAVRRAHGWRYVSLFDGEEYHTSPPDVWCEYPHLDRESPQ